MPDLPETPQQTKRKKFAPTVVGAIAGAVATTYYSTKRYVHENFKKTGLFDVLAAKRDRAINEAEKAYAVFEKEHPIAAFFDEDGLYFKVKRPIKEYKIGVQKLLADKGIIAFEDYWDKLASNQKTKVCAFAAGAAVVVGAIVYNWAHGSEKDKKHTSR